jgi:hypothetical protein
MVIAAAPSALPPMITPAFLRKLLRFTSFISSVILISPDIELIKKLSQVVSVHPKRDYF